jgi:quercetin dioxygenase-like cupin family protein
MTDNFRLASLGAACGLFMACSSGAGADPKAAASAPSSAATATIVKQLIEKDQVAAAGKELVMLTVEYPPGGSSPPHRHDSQVFVYVLEGVVNMQVEGGSKLTLQAGETFYESPNDVHTVSANASTTSPAKLLVFILKDKSAPISRPAGAKGST